MTSRVSVVPLTAKPLAAQARRDVVTPYRAVTVPVSSVPTPPRVVAIGEPTVSVRVVGSVPVLVSVSSVTATLL